MQQDGVKSLQSDRESLKETLCLLLLLLLLLIIIIIIFFLPSVSRIPRGLEKN